MSFLQAVSSVLGQYAGFRGRARRSEFWWWNLFTLLVGVLVAAAEVTMGLGDQARGPVSTVLALALLLPNLSVTVRRLHDTGRSGWWLLLAPVPLVGVVVLLVFLLSPSTPGPTAHGPDPRQAEPTAPGVPGAAGPGDPSTPDPAAPGSTPAWTPPGWELPSAAEPGAGRPAQGRAADDDGDTDRPPR